MPGVLDTKLVDEVIQVTNDESMRRRAGCRWKRACLWASARARPWRRRSKWPHGRRTPGKLIVAVLPDFGERYLSSVLFESLRQQALALPTRTDCGTSCRDRIGTESD